MESICSIESVEDKPKGSREMEELVRKRQIKSDE